MRIQLFPEDKHIIKRLSDRHINFVQTILRDQFPWCDGLQNTLLQSHLRFSVASKIVQILDIRSNHWVVISNIDCHNNILSVYGTVYNDIDSSTLTLLKSMFEEDSNISVVNN